VYAGGAAARDGRLRVGDLVARVNGADVIGWPTGDVIELLRRAQGRIELTVLQLPL